MRESFEEAVIELNRADHLIYVSLKYTRTVDVFRHIIERMITFLENLSEVILKKAKKDHKIFEIPDNPALKVEELRNSYPDDEKVIEIADFLTFLRKVMKSDYKKEGEFRKNVTMYTIVNNEEFLVNIEEIHKFYDKCKILIRYVQENYLE